MLDDKSIHPSIKYGKRLTSPLCDVLYELIQNNNIQLHDESLKFEYFVDSQKTELIQIFMMIKSFIHKNEYKNAELYIAKIGIRIKIKE